MLEVVAQESRRVLRDPQGEVAPVLPYIVEAMWDHHARRKTGKIVVVDRERSRSIAIAWPVELAQDLLLLRVEAQHRQARLQKRSFQLGNVLELLIAMSDLLHRLAFEHLTPTQIQVIIDPLDEVGGEIEVFLGQFCAHSARGQVGPSQVRIVGAAGDSVIFFQDLKGLFYEVRVVFFFRPPPALRTRPGGIAWFCASSFLPCRMVWGWISKAWLTQSTPCHPRVFASVAAKCRRCRSLSE